MIGRSRALVIDFLKRERGPAVESAVVLGLVIAACLAVALIMVSDRASNPPGPARGVGTSS